MGSCGYTEREPSSSVVPTLDEIERSGHLAPKYRNGIVTASDGQSSGIAAFLSGIGQINQDRKSKGLGDSGLWTVIR